MSLNTKSLFKGKEVAVTFQEALEELHEAYDAELGLDTGNAHVAVSTYESPVRDTIYERWCRIYVERDIKKTFGIELDAWLDQPRWQIDIQLRVAEDRARVEAKVAAGILAGTGGDDKKH